jgi:hypothetical protein
MQPLRGGRPYRVSGASSKTGEDVEIIVEAYDEADAARMANRQGVFVSRCVAAGADGSTWAAAAPVAAVPAAPPAPPPALTFADMIARDPTVQRLVRTHPQLAQRVKRLNDEDREFLSELVGEGIGISYRDSAHMRDLMKDADK